MSHNERCTSVALGAIALGAASIAQAGDVDAIWSFSLGGSTNFDWVFAAPVNGQSTVQFDAARTGGTDTLLPSTFITYCVEMGEYISGGPHNHPEVVSLPGNTTITGGVTGPILFDAIRTQHVQRLWANAFPLVDSNANLSCAFQLAQWELTFDDDMTLGGGGGGRFWVNAGQFQAGITDVAEAWLTNIRTGVWTAERRVVLLRGPNIQDQVGMVPEPATLGVLSLGVIALVSRRRR